MGHLVAILPSLPTGVGSASDYAGSTCDAQSIAATP